MLGNRSDQSVYALKGQDMGKVIGDILPLAVGVGISVVPIVAVILMLGTPRGRVNGVMFLIGWLLGAAIVGTVAIIIADSIGVSSGGASTGLNWFKIILGILLFFGALRHWRQRPKEGEKAQMPKWMETIDNFSGPKSAAIGAILSGVNPKNLALIVAAAGIIAQSGISVAQQAGAYIIFVVIGTIGVALPLIVYFAMGSRAVKILDGWNAWLSANNATVMSILFLVFSAVLIGKGITGLT